MSEVYSYCFAADPIVYRQQDNRSNIVIIILERSLNRRRWVGMQKIPLANTNLKLFQIIYPNQSKTVLEITERSSPIA